MTTTTVTPSSSLTTTTTTTTHNPQVHYGAMLVNCRHTVFDVVKEVMAGVTYQEAYRSAGLDASKRVSAYLAKVASRL